tara:strand:- start:3660 stop:3932 length:273 start_codon:yes stop_codon:yes gene_type:complete
MSKLMVTFDIKDKESFAEINKQIFDNMHGQPTDTWAVRFVSIEDEMKRLSDIETVVDQLSSYNAIDEIKEILRTNPDEYDVEANIDEWNS